MNYAGPLTQLSISHGAKPGIQGKLIFFRTLQLIFDSAPYAARVCRPYFALQRQKPRLSGPVITVSVRIMFLPMYRVDGWPLPEEEFAAPVAPRSAAAAQGER